MNTLAAVATLPVLDVHTTLAGPGPSAGRPVTVIYLGRGPGDGGVDRPVDAILDAVTAPVAVIAGEEPLVHQNTAGWRALLAGLARAGRRVQVETTGAVAPTPRSVAHVDLSVVSPPPDDEDPGGRKTSVALASFAELSGQDRAVLTVTVHTPEDCADVLVEADLFGWPRSAVWLLPGTAGAWAAVAAFAVAHHVNAAPPLPALPAGPP